MPGDAGGRVRRDRFGGEAQSSFDGDPRGVSYDGSDVEPPKKGRRLLSVPGYLVLGGLILVAFAWSHWSTLRQLMGTWLRSDEYSSGLLVPFLAI